MTDTTDTEKFEAWAIVDLFGHKRLAGHVQEFEIGGHGFLRIDIPPLLDEKGEYKRKGFSRFINPKAVYEIQPVDQGTAHRVAASLSVEPFTPWEMPEHVPALTGGFEDEDDADDGLYEDESAPYLTPSKEPPF